MLRLQSRDTPLREGEIRLLPPLSVGHDGGLELPPVANDIAERAIASIHDFHRALADANNDALWWYLPLSEWQPFMSVLPAAVDLAARIATLASRGCKGRYVIRVADATTTYYLMERFRNHTSIAVSADIADRAFWIMDRAKGIPRRWFNSLAWLWENLRAVNTNREDVSVPATLDTLLISRLEAAPIAKLSDHWEDLYLGDLPDEAQRRTGSAALLLRTAGNSKKQSQQGAAFRDFPIITVGSLLRPRNVLAILFRALRFRVKTGHAEPVLGRAARREARNHVRAIADWLLIEVAVERLLSQCKPRQIICMQENSGWEHAVVRAARRQRPEAILVGFFHCPVMPSAFRYRTRADVRDRRPLFQRIFPLGQAHRDALLRLGEWKPLLADRGYAFRNPQLDDCLALHVVPSMRPFTILVLLGGAFDNAVFLRWVAEALRPLDDVVVEIKSHPAYDPQSVLRRAGIAVDGKRFRLTAEVAMDRALTGSDVVVYKGTTVCFAALAAGVPLIHVGDGGVATDDTLFASDGLSESVSTAADFRAQIARLRAQGPQQRKSWAERARAYVREYYDMSASAREAVLNDLFPERAAKAVRSIKEMTDELY